MTIILFLFTSHLWAIEPCQDFKCDSLAVRAILDTNGMPDLLVLVFTKTDLGWTSPNKRIIELFILDRQLTVLPAEVGNLTRLTGLSLLSNQLMTLPTEIGKLAGLTLLVLSQNQLTAIPAEIGQISNLQYLQVSSNQLTAIPAEIGQLTNLKDLNLNENQLTAIPAEIGQLTSLTSLRLHGNQLTVLPTEFGKLTGLLHLYLNNNQLRVLPPEILQLTRLFTLNLDSNALCSLPDSISNWVDQYSSTPMWRETQQCQIEIEAVSQSPLKIPALSISPNPFTPTTTIRFQAKGQSEIRIYNLNGHLIRQWNPRAAVVWNGQDRHGRDVASGTYIIRIKAGDRILTKRLALIR